jgi:hypothetical protein
MALDFRKFDKDTTKFLKRIEGEEVGKRVRIITLDLFRRFRQLSPVDTGRYRAAWNIGIEKPDLSVPPPAKRVNAGAAPFSALKNLKPFPVVYITNNLPYAKRLEDGHSGQAPTGILREALVQAGYGRNTETILIR